MRVRVLRETRAYWNYAIQTFAEGEELDGDLARHLADNTPEGSVEVLEDDRQTEPEPQTPPPGDDTDPGDGTTTDPAATDGQPPVDGTIDALMAWIGDDPDRAAQALAAEQAKDKPRATVIKRLGGAE